MTSRLIQIHGDPPLINVFEPGAAGGFRLAWQGETVAPQGTNVGWFAADLLGVGGRQLIQAYSVNGNDLAMMLYKQSGPGFAFADPYAVDTTSAGRYFVAPTGLPNNPDVLVRVQASDIAIQLDVYGWSAKDKAIIRIGGRAPDGGSVPTVKAWQVIPHPGGLPDVVSLQVIGHTRYALVRYVANEDGEYAQHATPLKDNLAGVREILWGRTTTTGASADVILYDLASLNVIVYRVDATGYFAEAKRSTVPASDGQGSGLLPMLTGAIASQGLTDILYLKDYPARVGGVTYRPVNGAYQQMWDGPDTGVARRDGTPWLVIDGDKGQLAVVNCWTDPDKGAAIAVVAPKGGGSMGLSWQGEGLAPAKETGVWLVGLPDPSSR